MSLVVHVPHASLEVPDKVLSQYLISPEELHTEVVASADLYTDLLAKAAWPDAQIVSSAVSRLVVDVERYADDKLEPLAQVGRGMVYTHSHDGLRIRRDLSSSERNSLKRSWYDPHWKQLRQVAQGKVLVDLHSYPLAPWKIEGDLSAARPEIDLGTSEGLTPSGWSHDLKRHFQDFGYEVGFNTPYTGVIDACASAAIMIEVRRDMIGDPLVDEKWQKLAHCLSQMPVLE